MAAAKVVNSKNTPGSDEPSGKTESASHTADAAMAQSAGTAPMETLVNAMMAALMAQSQAVPPAAAKPGSGRKSEAVAEKPMDNAPATSVDAKQPAPTPVSSTTPESEKGDASSNPAQRQHLMDLSPVSEAPEIQSVATAAMAKNQPASPAKTTRNKQLPAVSQSVNTQPVVSSSSTQGDGTRGALNGQRMNSGSDKNDFAGGTPQNVPVENAPAPTAPAPSATQVAAAGPIVSPGSNTLPGKSVTGNSGAAVEPITTTASIVAELTAKLGGSHVTGIKAAAQPVDAGTGQAEPVGHLLNQQVVMVRQSGANNVAVSLKLDPQTELSMQLTNHNGQIEAAVRWERGDISGLGSHWKDLQDSLARQNVQLLPLQNKPASFSSGKSSDSASFEQSSRQAPRQDRRQGEEFGESPNLSTVTSSNKTKAQTISPQGWESWA